MAYAAARFAEGGFHPTSVAEIVSGLGVGKGVFYWYFDSKDELFLEILKDAQQGLRRAQQHAIAQGRIRDADPVVLSHAILGVVNHLSRTFLMERGEPADQVAEVAVAFCLDGLSAGDRVRA